jgi:hypothetical protein
MNMPGFNAENSLYGRSRKYTTFQPFLSQRDHSVISPQVPVGGGGGTRNNQCDDAWGGCYIGCSVDHPESKDSPGNLNAMLRQGCLDSCDAAHNLCTRALVVTPIGLPMFRGTGLLTR